MAKNQKMGIVEKPNEIQGKVTTEFSNKITILYGKIIKDNLTWDEAKELMINENAYIVPKYKEDYDGVVFYDGITEIDEKEVQTFGIIQKNWIINNGKKFLISDGILEETVDLLFNNTGNKRFRQVEVSDKFLELKLNKTIDIG